jgi:hypothetical protein
MEPLWLADLTIPVTRGLPPSRAFDLWQAESRSCKRIGISESERSPPVVKYLRFAIDFSSDSGVGTQLKKL